MEQPEASDKLFRQLYLDKKAEDMLEDKTAEDMLEDVTRELVGGFGATSVAAPAPPEEAREEAKDGKLSDLEA